jgi:hypothetical protein
MLAEHLIYSAALAILVGMLFLRFTGRDHSWIIILLAFAPDADYFIPRILDKLGFTVQFKGYEIFHGAFHTIGAMLVLGITIGLILSVFDIPTFDAILFSLIGFGAHLFEDALVYPAGYMYLWPFSHAKMGLGLLMSAFSEDYFDASFFHIANTDVLLIGIEFLILAILIRTRFEGQEWIRWYLPERMYRTWFAQERPDNL